MARPRFRAGPPGRAWFALMVAILLAKARAGSIDQPPPSKIGPVGRPVSVPVQAGRARFDLPGSDPDAQTLVIVSALSKQTGPFPITLSARPVDHAEVIEPGPPEGKRTPRLVGDPPMIVPVPPVSRPPMERTFHLMVQDGDVSTGSNYRPILSRLRAVGRRIQIYVGEGDEVDPATLREIVSTFDDEVYPAAARRFGPAIDTDGDGRFTVLMSGWLSRLSGGKVRVDGFVRGADLDPSVGAPFGNRADMMYLNTSLRAGPHLQTIVAHEYTHAVTFSRKPLADPSRGVAGPEEEGWLDEAIAHLVEDSHGFSRSNIDYRVSAYLSQPERYRLVVDDYYAADLFRSHGNRGATYLFLRWCVDQYGPGLIDQLVRSDRRGAENLESATGASFADLFRRWTVALYLSGLDPTRTLEGGYRSVEPRGDREDWILAGPRVSVVRPDRPEDHWSASGTTAHFAVVGGWANQALEIEIQGPPEAEIQVTLVPLPSRMGRPELVVRSSTGLDGEILVRAQVTERGGTAVRLGALAWEPLVPESDPHAARFRRDGLDGLGIVDAFGTSAIPPQGGLRSKPIRLAGVRMGDAPIVFKAVGTDPQGRRVAAWAVVDPPRRSDSAEVRK